MEVADTFIPTAGVVGLLPMVTYFFLVVALFIFLSSFVFTLAVLPGNFSEQRLTNALMAIISFLAALTYYLIQTYYRDMLSELATVTDANDRQTLIRESYNAIGQYRYINWFIVAPLLLLQTTFRLNVRHEISKRSLVALLIAGSSLFFISYIGHQQLSFDNEIQPGAKVVWGIIATIDYVFIVLTLNRFRKQSREQMSSANQRLYQLTALVVTAGWGIYLLGYFLTLTTIDFNWIHLLFTITDLISLISISVLTCWPSIGLSDQNS